MLVGKKIGPFTIDKELGAGAMGAVYRGSNAQTGQRVAIKVVAPGLTANKTAMKRFEREGAILKQLKHPNIVRLVLTGKFGSTPFYAMEYIEGESLDRVMARRGRISWEEVVTLGSQLCEALKHAHDKGIIHRDLKPSNVMVVPDDTGGFLLKLTDFGIAKDTDVTALTSANCTVGTAAYMSPEQCRGERDLTAKSDLYSLGVMFYELITGQKPFKADSPMDMFMLHVQGTFERPSRLVLDIPVWLDNLICQLLEKKPEQRPRDAAMVADTLSRIKEKVEAQRSAGEDISKARGDRPLFDEEDKAAIRSLLGKKKKKKKKGRPFYQQVWFKASLYSALLVAILVIFWAVFLKRPSADTLFTQASKAKDAETLDERLKARNGPIADFLRYYPDHPKAAEVRAWVDEIDRDKAEKDLVDRFRDEKTSLDPDELEIRKAIKHEEEGKFEEARKIWEKFPKFKGAADPDKNGYALVAEDRLKTLDWVKSEDDRLWANVKKAGPLRDFKPSGEQEQGAAKAYQAELNDLAEGRAAWEKFQGELKRDDRKDRPWYLLAAKHLHDLPPAPKSEKKEKGALRRPDGAGAYARLAPALTAPPGVRAAQGSRPVPATPSPPRTSSSPRRADRSGRA
jgi:eukaryotic-like serine/threonine-protein kinase